MSLPAPYRKYQRSRMLRTVLTSVLVLLAVAASLLPVAWIVSTSLKDRAETFQVPPTIIPHRIYWQNYITIWRAQPFGRYFTNSAVVALSTCIFSLMIANIAAFGFSRYRMRHSFFLQNFILLTQMFPAVLLVIPYFIMMSKVGLTGYPALIIAYTSFALPFCTWMLKGYYDSIPKEIDEAALIDGCSRFQLFRRVVLPLTLPGNVATVIFAFLLSWNEFLFALSLAKDQMSFTIPVGIALFVGEYRVAWNEIMATAVVASIPVVLMYILFDKELISGLVDGSIKR